MDKWANVYAQFYIDWAVEFSTYLVYYVGHLIPASFFIGMCFYVNAMLADLTIQIREIDEDVKNHRKYDYSEIGHKLCNEIQFNVHIFRSSANFQQIDNNKTISNAPFISPLFRLADIVADIMSIALFLLLLMYAITIAVFMFGTVSADPCSLRFFGSLVGVVNLVLQLTAYCNQSENVTSDLSATGDLFYHSLWYRLPIKLQKLYIIPIQLSQKEFRLTGLGMIECSLRIVATVQFLFLYLHLT